MRICEQLNEEPDPEKMPVSPSMFPEEVQSAFFIYNLLEDNWDGTSGSYMGKVYYNLEFLFKLYEIDNQPAVLLFLKIYDSLVISFRSDKAEAKRKAAERRSSAGSGKSYTHSVKG